MSDIIYYESMLDHIKKSVNEMKDFAKQINHLLQKASLLPLEKETVEAKVEELSDNAILGLKQAIKNKELHRIFSILGIEFKPKKIKKEDIDV